MSTIHLLTLLAVRLRSRGDAEAIQATVADLTGDAAVDVSNPLVTAVAEGQIRVRGEEGRRSLTSAGEAELAALLAADTDAAGRADVVAAYEVFLPLNRRFLAACVAWQEDRVGLDILVVLVNELGPILDAITEVRSRFGSYRLRFESALTAAVDDPAWVDSPSLDSVHTIWFELHEHLLATIGRDRTEER